jgi:RHS repeat-associated protein
MMQASVLWSNEPNMGPLSPGKERDSESGNDYFDARYYSSEMGRFLSPDWSTKEDPVPYAKLDDPQTLNLYAYVLNNPLRLVDDDGHEIKLASDATAQDRSYYARATAYLSGNAGEAAIINNLNAVQTVYTVKFIDEDDPTSARYDARGDRFDPNTNTIYWDPRSALATTANNGTEGGGTLNGDTQTPALGLGHEMDHANGSETGTAEHGNDPNYGNNEEKRVITGSETNAAGALGEGTRTNHGGATYQSVSPTSRIPTQQGVQQLRAAEAARHQHRRWFHVKNNQNQNQ